MPSKGSVEATRRRGAAALRSLLESSSARGRGQWEAGWAAVAPGRQERTSSLTLSSQPALLGGRRRPPPLC